MTQRKELIAMLDSAGVRYGYSGADCIVIDGTCRVRFGICGALREVLNDGQAEDEIRSEAFDEGAESGYRDAIGNHFHAIEEAFNGLVATFEDEESATRANLAEAIAELKEAVDRMGDEA
jgi:hypothetical protein